MKCLVGFLMTEHVCNCTLLHKLIFVSFCYENNLEMLLFVMIAFKIFFRCFVVVVFNQEGMHNYSFFLRECTCIGFYIFCGMTASNYMYIKSIWYCVTILYFNFTL